MCRDAAPPAQDLQSEGLYGLNVVRPIEVDLSRGHDNDGGHIERHHRLSVRVVTKERFTTKSLVGHKYLIQGVPDGVDVDVVPAKLHSMLSVTGVGIGDGQPAEWGPSVLGQRLKL